MRFGRSFSLAAACASMLVFGGCGGGGGAPPAQQPPAQLTAQDLLETCAVADLQDFAGILELLQGFLEGNDQVPLPQLDLLTAFLTGRVPFTWDLDQDGTPELSGSFFFTDADGEVTIPIDLDDLGGLLGGDPDALAAAFASIPAGTTLHLGFDADGLLQQDTGLRSGDGDFEFLFGANGVESVSGSGAFASGDCAFEFNFTDIPVDVLDVSEFPVAAVGFDLRAGDNSVAGSIDLDGSSQARVEAALNGGAPEVFFVDLAGGTAAR